MVWPWKMNHRCLPLAWWLLVWTAVCMVAVPLYIVIGAFYLTPVWAVLFLISLSRYKRLSRNSRMWDRLDEDDEQLAQRKIRRERDGL